MEFYDRRTKEYDRSEQYGGGLLEKLYGTWWGNALSVLVLTPVFSRINGWFNSLPASRRKIAPFAARYRVDLSACETTHFRSFNEFFTRRLKEDARPLYGGEEAFLSPADSKLLVYPIRAGQTMEIKGHRYTVQELAGNSVSAAGYEGGVCLVFRLAMEDYHRYCFPASGRLLHRHFIRGKLHTVSSASRRHRIYRENCRLVNVLETGRFGELIMIEVGALLVGRIADHGLKSFQRGQEKGYFRLGGSAIVLLLPKGALRLDEDILSVTQKGIEVRVRYRETIGISTFSGQGGQETE